MLIVTSIVFSPYSTLLNSATLTNSLSPLPNSFITSVKKFSIDLNSTPPNSKSAIKFSFQTSAELSYTYDNIHWTCSSTNTLLILILKYSLYAIMNPTTLLAFLLNISGLATFMLNPILGSDPSTATTPLPTVIIVYKATIYSYYILICFKS